MKLCPRQFQGVAEVIEEGTHSCPALLAMLAAQFSMRPLGCEQRVNFAHGAFLTAFGNNQLRRAAGLVPAGMNPAARSFLPFALVLGRSGRRCSRLGWGLGLDDLEDVAVGIAEEETAEG